MSQASAVRSSTVALKYGAPPFVCSWEIGDWGVAWVQVVGELDLVTSPQFRQTLGEAQRAVRLVVLDLRELCFIDSSGVHLILDAADDARRKAGQLLIVRGPTPVDRMLTLTKVGKQVVIFDLAPAKPAPALLHVAPSGLAA